MCPEFWVHIREREPRERWVIETRLLPRLPFNLAHTENTPHQKNAPRGVRQTV